MAGKELTPQEEIEGAIEARVRELIIAGDPNKAAAIEIEYKRSLLPDTHPSKRPGTHGDLAGEQVSQMVKFDEETRALSEEIAFMSAITAGGMSPDMAIANMRLLGRFLMSERPDALLAVTQYLLREKKALGIIPDENKELGGEAPQTDE